jgi:hypothetical protein
MSFSKVESEDQDLEYIEEIVYEEVTDEEDDPESPVKGAYWCQQQEL